jgi:hypothetical protein
LALWSAALLAALAAYGVGRLVTSLHPIPAAIAILGTFGVGYVALTVGAGVPEASGAVKFLRR